MTLRNLGICVVLATVSANAGCVTQCHKGYQKSLECGPECDLPPVCRGQVHVFMMHGLTPSTESGLDALRLKLADNGFAKVGTGEMCNYFWVNREIECIRQHDPDARFVLLGYDCGGAVACSLARDLTEKGVPVDAVVLLNPVGCSAEPCGARTLLITSGKVTSTVPHSAKVIVPDVAHHKLPAHPTTVAAITDLLREIAQTYWQPPVEEVPVWNYPHAPEVRRAPVKAPRGEWDFLADKPGPVRPIGTQVVAQPAPQPVTQPKTGAGAVTLKP